MVVGYIAPGSTGVDGNIVIRAYLDSSKIAISDTYTEEFISEVITSGYDASACEIALDEIIDADVYCETAESLQEAIDDEDLESEDIELLVSAGIVRKYNEGTTSEWVAGREVFTTTEWNGLQTNGVSFKVKVEANEGIWVENPNAQASAVPIQSCVANRCVYIRNTSNTDFGDQGMQIGDVVDLSDDSYSDNYDNFRSSVGRGYWLGLVLDENDAITEGYVCNDEWGDDNDVIVCARGGIDESESNDKTVFNENLQKLNTACGSENVFTYDNNGDGLIDEAVYYIGFFDDGNVYRGDGDCQFYSGYMTCFGP